MAASREAMDDLRRILAGRAAFYAKADLTRRHQRAARWTQSFAALRDAVRAADSAADRLKQTCINVLDCID